MIIEENNASDSAQLAAARKSVRDVSGLGGRFFAHSTRRDKNLIPAAATKIIAKVRLKKIANFAKFFTFLD